MAHRRGLRAKSSWWLALLAVLTGVLVFYLLRKSSRPESAGRETTTTGAEVQGGDAGAPLIGAANPACATHVDCKDGALCTRSRCEPITATTPECRDATIRFARGTAELSSVAQLTVERGARCLKSNRHPRLTFERSSDPFRSAQANEELTKARASTIRRALEERGVERKQPNAIGGE